MKVYVCYLRVQKVEHWEIISDGVHFITDSPQKCREWDNTYPWYSEDQYFYYTTYSQEFELQ